LYFYPIKKAIQYFSFLLVGLFLLALIGPVTTIVHFYKNQSAIEEAFCENKDKPMLQCHGHCFLKKSLKNTKLVDQQESPNELKVSILLPFAFEELNSIDLFEFEKFVKNQLFKQYCNQYNLLRIENILDPPEKFFI